MSTGGMSTGGMSTGGMSTGGMSTGGMSTGGLVGRRAGRMAAWSTGGPSNRRPWLRPAIWVTGDLGDRRSGRPAVWATGGLAVWATGGLGDGGLGEPWTRDRRPGERSASRWAWRPAALANGGELGGAGGLPGGCGIRTRARPTGAA
jgi:hypothetical protein